MALLLSIGKVAFLAAPAMATPPALPVTADRLLRNLTGQFDNTAQYARADSALKVAPSVAGAWLDLQHATMIRIDAPAIGAHVLYLEWRGGSRDGPVSRQRIWAFDDAGDTVRMRFYTIVRPERFAGRGGDADRFRSLKSDDLVGYPRECDAVFRPGTVGVTAFGRIDPARCRIVAQSGRGMRLDVTIDASSSGFTYQEAGLLDSGARAFAVPPNAPYSFVRVAGR